MIDFGPSQLAAMRGAIAQLRAEGMSDEDIRADISSLLYDRIAEIIEIIIEEAMAIAH